MPTLTHAPICVRTCIPLSLYTLHFKQTISIHRWTQYIRALKPHTKSTYLNWTLNPSDDWARQRAIPFVNWLCCGQVSSSYNLSSLSYSTNPWGEQSREKNLGDVFLLTCVDVLTMILSVRVHGVHTVRTYSTFAHTYWKRMCTYVRTVHVHIVLYT